MPVANYRRKKEIGGSGTTERPFDNPIRIGCAGWSIPGQFAGSFAPTGSHLERYSQIFNCCEINSSFYRPHKNETWARWAATVPAGFQFSVKLPRTITHEAKLNSPPELLSAFLDQINHLGEKLGPILVQLPPSLEFNQHIATKFLTMLRRRFSGEVVWEPRHATWFDADAGALLNDHGIARVAADPACVPAAAHPSGASHLVYFRLHGSPRRYFSAYDADYLKRLSLQTKQLANKARVWCIFDNTGLGAATANALELIAKGRQARCDSY